MLAIYHNAPEGHAGSGTSDDLNQFRIFSAAFKWTLNQVGVCRHQQTPELNNNRWLFARWRTGRKTGRDSEWQAKNVERQLIISHQEPVHASEVIITTCSLCISINELLKKKKTVLTSWFICPSILPTMSQVLLFTCRDKTPSWKWSSKLW